MTVVSTLINIDFYKTSERRTRTYGLRIAATVLYLRGCASREQQPRKVKNVRSAGDCCAGFARRNRGWKRLPSLFCALKTSRSSITKLPCRLQKRRKNRTSSLAHSPCSLSFHSSLPFLFLRLSCSRWIRVFVFGNPVSRERETEIIAAHRILIVATYDLVTRLFCFHLWSKSKWRFEQSSGGRPWIGADLHFILMSALNSYRLLGSACSPPRSREMIIAREKSHRWGMLHATFVPVTGQLPFGASIVIKTLSLLWTFARYLRAS